MLTVVIPFRDRGNDPTRRANLEAVLRFWRGFAPVITVSDGRTGDQQFNRHAAYNRAVTQNPNTDVFLFTEADTLTPFPQVREAIRQALEAPGLVVPFTERHHLTEEDSERVRKGAPAHAFTPEYTRGNRRNAGAVNALSRETINLVGGWDETFDGHWFDDDAMKIAFDVCTQPTRFIDGPAYHLWHKSPSKGDHLTREDKAATRRNRQRLALYRQADTIEKIHNLTL